MGPPNALPLILGLAIFSFLISSVLIVPFIDLLYKFKITRRKEGLKAKKASLFDKLHDIKAGTPVGGGILIIVLVSLLFGIIYPLVTYFGVYIQSSYNNLIMELVIIFLTFISFGLLGLSDDLIKIFGKPVKGNLGMWVGMRRREKFVLQSGIALFIGFLLYRYLGVHFIHIPMIQKTINMGVLYIPFAAFVIISFSNAYNITDGLDGLASGLLMICLIAFIVIAESTLDTPLSMFIALWLGALMAFLYFNVWPARIFMGDAGALSFGATLAVVGLLTGHLMALFVIGGIFVIEAFSSAIQILGWKILKRPILPLSPVHHSFLALGWEEPKIVTRAWLAGIMLAIFGLWLATI